MFVFPNLYKPYKLDPLIDCALGWFVPAIFGLISNDFLKLFPNEYFGESGSILNLKVPWLGMLALEFDSNLVDFP